MDETKDTQGNPLPLSGQAPESDGGTTPLPKTYTEEEVEKRIHQDRVARGREEKPIKEREALVKGREDAATDREAAIDAASAQRDAADFEAARYDPDKLASYQARKKREADDAARKAEADDIKQKRAQLERDKAEHEKSLEAPRAQETEFKILKIAREHKLDPGTLADYVTELKLTTVEQVTALAKRLASGQVQPGEPPAEPKPGEPPAEPKPTLIPSSLVGTSAGQPSLEQLGDMPMPDYAAQRRKQEPDKFPL